MIWHNFILFNLHSVPTFFGNGVVHAHKHLPCTYTCTQRLQLVFHNSPIQSNRIHSVSSRSHPWAWNRSSDMLCTCESVCYCQCHCVFLHLLAGYCSITQESQLASLSLTPISSGPTFSYMVIVVLNGLGKIRLPHYSKNVQLTTRGMMLQNLRAAHPLPCHDISVTPSLCVFLFLSLCTTQGQWVTPLRNDLTMKADLS